MSLSTGSIRSFAVNSEVTISITEYVGTIVCYRVFSITLKEPGGIGSAEEAIKGIYHGISSNF